MALNFGILDPDAPAKIVGSVYAGQQERQQNELAQQQAQMRQQLGTQQLETGRLQQQQSQMQMDQMIRDRDALAKLQQAFVANGKSPDLEANFDEMIRSGIQHFVDIGIKGKQKILEQKQFAGIMDDGAAAPANALAPAQPAWEPAPGAVPIRQGLTPGTPVTTFDGSGTPTNALAPAPVQAPAAAQTNALVPKSDVAAMRSKRDRLLAMGTTQSIAAAKALDADIKLASAPPVYHNVPGVGLVDPSTGRVVTPSVEKPAAPPVSIAEYERAQKDPEFMRFLQQKAIAMRPPAAPKPEPAPRTQQVQLADGSIGIINMDTGAITSATLGGVGVKGKPSATAEKTAIQRKQLGLDLDRAIIELTDVIKEGGLIDQSTGSGAGRLVDLAAGFGGKAMPGAIAIGKLQPIADLALKMVPRFEGPQSNADTTSYKQAAGQLADATLPREIRKEAAKTVLRLMKSRKDQFASPEMAAEGVTLGESSAPSEPPAVVRGRAGGPAVVQGTGGYKYLGKESK